MDQIHQPEISSAVQLRLVTPTHPPTPPTQPVPPRLVRSAAPAFISSAASSSSCCCCCFFFFITTSLLIYHLVIVSASKLPPSLFLPLFKSLRSPPIRRRFLSGAFARLSLFFLSFFLFFNPAICSPSHPLLISSH